MQRAQSVMVRHLHVLLCSHAAVMMHKQTKNTTRHFASYVTAPSDKPAAASSGLPAASLKTNEAIIQRKNDMVIVYQLQTLVHSTTLSAALPPAPAQTGAFDTHTSFVSHKPAPDSTSICSWQAREHFVGPLGIGL